MSTSYAPQMPALRYLLLTHRESQNCKLAGPALQRISGPGAAFDLVELDVERNQDLAESHKVCLIPA
jgi:hypothetical protein